MDVPVSEWHVCSCAMRNRHITANLRHCCVLCRSPFCSGRRRSRTAPNPKRFASPCTTVCSGCAVNAPQYPPTVHVIVSSMYAFWIVIFSSMYASRIAGTSRVGSVEDLSKFHIVLTTYSVLETEHRREIKGFKVRFAGSGLPDVRRAARLLSFHAPALVSRLLLIPL